MTYPVSRFDHLRTMIGPFGIYEHAKHDQVRVEHGYCVDDVARVLLVAVREATLSADVLELANIALDFLDEAQCADGTFKNRRSSSGVFLGVGTKDDCWGRAVWSLGVTVGRCTDERLRSTSLRLIESSLDVRSTWPRSMAFATLGAASVLEALPAHRAARHLVEDAAVLLARPHRGDNWVWPEETLTYANAVLPEALMAVGTAMEDDALVQLGLEQLRWLVETETSGAHLSVTSSKGHRRGTRAENFDQQPIEVAALCDASARAFKLTGDPAWARVVELSVQWFLGNNDLGEIMFNPLTWGGYDGLTESGPNLNQGTESTLALLATLQHAQLLQRAP